MRSQMPFNSHRRCLHWLIAVPFLLQVLGGWNENSDSSGVRLPPVNQPAGESLHGRFVGTVTIDEVIYFGDAIVAQDGTTHVYIGGPHADVSTIQLASPEGSINFVGNVLTHGNVTTGSGLVVGRKSEDCGQPGSPSARWCWRGSSADIALDHSDSDESGTIRGEIRANREVWMLDLVPWTDSHDQPARLSDLQGLYSEVVAPLLAGGILGIDPDGRAFISSFYLCVGNGAFSPHGDGDFNVFDVEMSITNCDYPYSTLNGEYRGLATLSPGNYQGTDVNLRVWLWRWTPGYAAIAMWGNRA